MQLKYGLNTIEFSPPSDLDWRILQKNEKETAEDKDVLIPAVSSLCDQLQDTITATSRLLIVIPDHTRRCRLDVILPLLTEKLESLGAEMEFLVANGSHIIQPDYVVDSTVGPLISGRYKISQHDCKDDGSLTHFGETSRGTPVWLNRKVKEADYILTVGGVLYHYFAGFGGGPKMIVPGVAGHETIRLNHRRTIDESTGQFHRFSREGEIDSNPVYQDLAEAAGMVPGILSLQVVLDSQNRFVHAFAGPVATTHRSICEKVKSIYGFPVAEKADVVIASAGGYPTDANLIQSHKAIHHAFQAVTEGGTVIVLAQCGEGVGSSTFLPYFDSGSATSIGTSLLQSYRINGHTALALKSKTEQTNIYLVSDLSPDIVSKTGMIPADSLEQALGKAGGHLETGALGYVLPEGHVTVPEFEPEGVSGP
jgi:nickel-dependent lactate racemase